jgi:LysR family transcriptional regulator, benzoate and cis,cis-muconate-responsive activator of ben and cat genes
VPDITREFRIANPDVRVELTYMTNPAQRDKILQDDIDFGFIEGSFQSSEIESVPVARHRLVTLLSPNHPLAVKDALTIEELAGEQLVMGTKVEWPMLRRIVVDIFQRAGQVMSVGHEGSSLTAILGLATAGVGITVFCGMPRFAARMRSPRGRPSPIRRSSSKPTWRGGAPALKRRRAASSRRARRWEKRT